MNRDFYHFEMHKTILCNYGNPMHDPSDGGLGEATPLWKKSLGCRFISSVIFFIRHFLFILIIYLSSRTQLHTSYREWEIISPDREWRPKLFHTIASDDRNYFTRSRVTTYFIFLFLFFHNFDSPIASDTVVTRDRAHDQDTTMRSRVTPGGTRHSYWGRR